jgi:cell division protein FtsB
MRVSKKQKKFVKILSSKLFLFVLILLFAGITKITIEKYIEVQKAKATLEEEQKNIKEGEKKSKELEETLKYFQSKEYIESVAKKKLNLVKPGEKVIYVMPEEEKEKEKKEEEQKEKEKSFWDNLKEIFSKEEKKE